MNLQSKYKIHRLVEYVKLQEWCFDTYDVLEALDMILLHFDFHTPLSQEELAILQEELLEIALAYEFAEVTKIVKKTILV
jgi:hypothetical protein